MIFSKLIIQKVFKNRTSFFRCFYASESLLKNTSVLYFSCELSSFQQFLETEAATILQIEKKYALPYMSLNSVTSQLISSKSVPFKPSDSSLYDFCLKGYLQKPSIDINYVINHVDEVEQNIKSRKTENVNVCNVIDLYQRIQALDNEIGKNQTIVNSDKHAHNMVILLTALKKELEKIYFVNALALPNQTCPSVPNEKIDKQLILETVGKKPIFKHEIFDHIVIANRMRILRQSNMSRMAGHRNYFFIGGAAELEQALIQYTIDKLRKNGFLMISVPNILKDAVFEGAGLMNRKMDTMVYNVENTADNGFCLAGTSELGLCTYFSSHSVYIQDLPLKVCSVSTCYRRETGTRLDRKGVFRVHQFLKVEMFGVTANENGNESADLHNEFVSIQKQMFEELGLHFNVINMPAYELGLPAYKKIDIEAWFPGRNKYDEISSASNCTDYQSRRLHILYRNVNNYKFAHTVNATACAVPRMIIALLENGQQDNYEVALPSCLWPYMNGKKFLKKENIRMLEYVGVDNSKHRQAKVYDNLID